MKQTVIGKVLLVMWLIFFLSGYPNKRANALLLKPQNIQAMAIYGSGSNYGIGLLSSLNFNITDPTAIANLISAIEFSTERDCSAMLAQSNAYVYVKFQNGTIDVYDLFGLWSHISKVGLHGSCYFVSETGQTLFENNAQ